MAFNASPPSYLDDMLTPPEFVVPPPPPPPSSCPQAKTSTKRTSASESTTSEWPNKMAKRKRHDEEVVIKVEEVNEVFAPNLDHLGECRDFDIDALAWAIQNGLSNSCIDRYLKLWSKSDVEEELAQPVLRGPADSTYPILFFAVERNDPELVRLLCRAGADPTQTTERPSLPLLAYCIISAEYELSDTNDCLSASLAMGTSPYDIPQDMWCDYIKAPKKQSYEAGTAMTTHPWCTIDVRGALCRNFNLLQRYWCKVASLLPHKTPRQKQVAAAFDLTPLFEIPYQIISQPLAAKLVQEWLTSHALHHVDTPLVLLFTGPSGHGKTELAMRMGQLLSVPFLKIDCTQMTRESDLFGARAPYQGWEAGSQLNSFLSDHSGKKAVVFLDEFEKTTADIHESLLLIFDEGFYKDRRTHDKKQLDLSQIIWVLASNLGDQIIHKHWNEHLADKADYYQLITNSIDVLQYQLERNFYTTLGAPLTGRLSAIIPFLPFSKEERAVTTYKFMRKLFNETRKPINVAEKHLARHLYLKFHDDGLIGSFVADKYYFPELGARSLSKAVNTQVCHKLTKAFLGQGEEITDELNDQPWACFDVKVEDLKGGFKEITIKANGTKNVQKRPVQKCCPQRHRQVDNIVGTLSHKRRTQFDDLCKNMSKRLKIDPDQVHKPK
ncbi:MAG: hypothetical protein Q9218_006101 [Villophora microphyllina]